MPDYNLQESDTESEKSPEQTTAEPSSKKSDESPIDGLSFRFVYSSILV